jgi:hypothetical protein
LFGFISLVFGVFFFSGGKKNPSSKDLNFIHARQVLYHSSHTPTPNAIGWIFETRSCCVAWASLKLWILLPQPPKCWDYRLDRFWILYAD